MLDSLPPFFSTARTYIWRGTSNPIPPPTGKPRSLNVFSKAVTSQQFAFGLPAILGLASLRRTMKVTAFKDQLQTATWAGLSHSTLNKETSMEHHEAKAISEVVGNRPWRKMNWSERLVATQQIVLGLGDDIFTLLTASKIVPRKVEWLWPNRVPLGKLTFFVGNPDNGKSLVATYVAATITTGRHWFDAKNSLSPGEALIFSAEDDPSDTTVPRLRAANANLTKIHFAKMCVGKSNETPMEREMRLDVDIEAIGKTLQENPNIRLVIIDPISNHLGQIEMNKEQDVRRALTPLQRLAAENRVAILGIMHLNKKQELQVIHRVGGAMAFVGVARAVWLFRANDEKRDEFHMLCVKKNIGKRSEGLVYRIGTETVDIEGEPDPQPFIDWIRETNQSADDAIASRPSGRPRDKRVEGLEWVKQFLSEGPKPANEVEARCEAEGFSYRTLQRVKGEASVQSVKKDDVWYWQLTDSRVHPGTEAEGRQDS
jgi:putative DNA primase/helicase